MSIRYLFVMYFTNPQRLILTVVVLSTIKSVIELNESSNSYYKNYALKLGNFFNSQITLQYGFDRLYQIW
jgi:hypothetical protein